MVGCIVNVTVCLSIGSSNNSLAVVVVVVAASESEVELYAGDVSCMV